jgi:hypothetical protein
MRLRISVLFVIKLCSLVCGYECFGGTYCLYFRCKSSALKMEAACSFEAIAPTFKTTRYHNREYRNVKSSFPSFILYLFIYFLILLPYLFLSSLVCSLFKLTPTFYLLIYLFSCSLPKTNCDIYTCQKTNFMSSENLLTCLPWWHYPLLVTQTECRKR